MFKLFKKKRKFDAQKYVIDIILSAINDNQSGLHDALKTVTENH